MSRYYYKISDGIEDYINATDMSSAALEAVQTELTRGVKFSQGIVAIKVRAEGDSDFSMILVDQENIPVSRAVSDSKISSYLQGVFKGHNLFRRWGYGTYQVTVFGNTEKIYGKKHPGIVNPHNFQPDFQANTEEEISNWQQALEKWDEAASGLWMLIHDLKNVG